MRLATEWVRDNIAEFGGDPGRIGFYGFSSGGCAISYLSYAYPDDPIASSVILGSGNEFIDILTRDAEHTSFLSVAEHFGCEGEDSVECMRGVDGRAITAYLGATRDAGTLPYLIFSPLVDNITIFEDYNARAQAGGLSCIPALIGSAADDGTAFMPYDPVEIDVESADALTQSFFFCPSLESASVREENCPGAVARRYVFAGNFTNLAPLEWMGAYHGAELPMVFGTHGDYRGESTGLEEETSLVMQDVWLGFVEGEVGWGAGEVMEFGGEGGAAVVVDYSGDEGLCGVGEE